MQSDEDMKGVFDDHEDVVIIGKLSRGYVEVIAGANEDDIDKVAEPIVALEYTRWSIQVRIPPTERTIKLGR